MQHFFSSYCCRSPGNTEEVNDFSWLNSHFLWQKSTWFCQSAVLCSLQRHFFRGTIEKRWFPHGRETVQVQREFYFLQKTCCLAFFTRCSSFRFFCRACLLEMSSTCSEGNQPLSRSESFTPSIHPSLLYCITMMISAFSKASSSFSRAL